MFTFEDECKQAIELYKKAFNAKVKVEISLSKILAYA